MHRWPVTTALALLLGSTATSRAADAPSEITAADTPFAFNGRDLTGFTTWLKDSGRADPDGVFTVRDGAIRISGDGYGYLATERAFRDFTLELEFRWGDQEGLDREVLGRDGKALDSGVFLFASGSDGNSHDGEGAFMAAVECNLFEGACGDILLIRGDGADGNLIAPRVTVAASTARDRDGFPWWDPGGKPLTVETWGRVNARGKSPDWKDVRGTRSPDSPERPPGEWNHLEITARDGVVSVSLNGRSVNHITDVDPAEGKILLQCEGSEVWFRKLVVVPRSPNPGPRGSIPEPPVDFRPAIRDGSSP